MRITLKVMGQSPIREISVRVPEYRRELKVWSGCNTPATEVRLARIGPVVALLDGCLFGVQRSRLLDDGPRRRREVVFGG